MRRKAPSSSSPLLFFTHTYVHSKKQRESADLTTLLNLVCVKANHARAIEIESIHLIDFSNSWETVGRELLSIRVNHRSHLREPERGSCRCARRKFTQPRGNSPPVFNEKKKQKKSNGDVFALRERVWLRLVRGEGHGLDRGHAASRRGNRQVRFKCAIFF